MDRLSNRWLRQNEIRRKVPLTDPETILQFGEGGFLRGFFDAFVDIVNEYGGKKNRIVVADPRGTSRIGENLSRQDGLYTVIERGYQNEKMIERVRTVDVISRCLDPKKEYEQILACAQNEQLWLIVSNTTEAGIVFDPDCRREDSPPTSFPAKLTQFLYERFQTGLPGFVILSCELIDHNGDALARCVKQYAEYWEMPQAFIDWLQFENRFCNTLVDRIVTRYEPEQPGSIHLPYDDRCAVVCEPFAQFVIEADKQLFDRLPMQECGLPVIFTDDSTPYKLRKVRMLNGIHTFFALAAYLCGFQTVQQVMRQLDWSRYIQTVVIDEIYPVVKRSGEAEASQFAQDMFQRFKNPFIAQMLSSILLNQTAKWTARLLPTVKEYYNQFQKLPQQIVFMFAVHLYVYQNAIVLQNGSRSYFNRHVELTDNSEVLAAFSNENGVSEQSFLDATLARTDIWEMDLRKIPLLQKQLEEYMVRIRKDGLQKAIMEHVRGGAGCTQSESTKATM